MYFDVGDDALRSCVIGLMFVDFADGIFFGLNLSVEVFLKVYGIIEFILYPVRKSDLYVNFFI